MKLRILALLSLCAVIASLQAQTPALSSSKCTYRTGQNISIAFTNGPANPRDWIGIYPSNVEPGIGPASTIWFYVDGTRDGNTGLADGLITFTNGLSTTGSWIAYLLEDDGYNKLASVPFTTVPGPSVTTDKSHYATNETIQVTFANGPGNPADWIGIYPEGATPGGPEATIWEYGNGTRTATTGATNGTVVFNTGLATPGNWVVYFLEDDGYIQLASASFTVGVIPAVATEHSTYFVSAPVTASFTNGPANLKDWIAVYPEGVAPGGPPAAIWQYTDANGGKAGVTNGAVTFGTGLTNTGNYVIYFLKDDGYDILATNKFSVVATDAPLLWLDKKVYETRQPIVASFTNAPGNPRDWVGVYPAGVLPAAGPIIWYYLDGTKAGNDAVISGTLTFPTGLGTVGNWVAYLLENDGYNVLGQEPFTVVAAPITATNLVLSTPLYFENFDSVAEGQLPAGWTSQSFTDVLDENLDLGDLNSKSYANWTVVSAARFNSPLLSYTAHESTDDYKRVLSTNLNNLVNGVTITNLGAGNILFGDSGYRDGRSQVIYLFTPDYDLTGKTNIEIAFHSLYEQNQDSIGALEYSIDRGTNWLPIIYLIDAADVLTNATGGIDAVSTLTTEYPMDVAYYDDPDTGETIGGTYGSFIAAPISDSLAPYISGRIDDDPSDSKRVEHFLLPRADNQPTVRFRFAYAGTDSWYWGIDDFGIYAASSGGSIHLTVTKDANNVTVSWTGGEGRLQKTTALGSGNWQEVTIPAGTESITETTAGGAAFYRVLAQ